MQVFFNREKNLNSKSLETEVKVFSDEIAKGWFLPALKTMDTTLNKIYKMGSSFEH